LAKITQRGTRRAFTALSAPSAAASRRRPDFSRSQLRTGAQAGL